jgi:NADH-quinone oxidoreductase subunit B
MGLESNFDNQVITTTIDSVINWGRKYSLWPMPFGTACCAIEFMGVVLEPLRRVALRRRARALLTAPGRPHARDGHDHVPHGAGAPTDLRPDADPKWVISMGVCASSGGFYDNYSVVPGHR